jgi:carboxylesterase
MEGLGEALRAAGLAVSIPLLPGHGTDGSDFLRTGWRDWLGACAEAMAELCARHGRVSVAGFSMGGLIAILLAVRFPVARMALLAPPVKSRDPRLPFTPVLGLFIRRRRREILEPLPDDPEEARLVREYRGYRYPRQLAGIAVLARQARRALPCVTAPTLTVVARHDRYVDPSVIGDIESRMACAEKRHLVVEGQHRSLLEGAARDAVRAEVVRWLAAGGGGV